MGVGLLNAMQAIKLSCTSYKQELNWTGLYLTDAVFLLRGLCDRIAFVCLMRGWSVCVSTSRMRWIEMCFDNLELDALSDLYAAHRVIDASGVVTVDYSCGFAWSISDWFALYHCCKCIVSRSGFMRKVWLYTVCALLLIGRLWSLWRLRLRWTGLDWYSPICGVTQKWTADNSTADGGVPGVYATPIGDLLKPSSITVSSPGYILATTSANATSR